jgi:hypothetical protein
MALEWWENAGLIPIFAINKTSKNIFFDNLELFIIFTPVTDSPYFTGPD